MIKIKYPDKEADRREFDQRFVEALNFPSAEIVTINTLLSKVTWKAMPLSLETLLVSRFEDLEELNRLLFHHLTVTELMELHLFFDYDSRQQKIADFFMSQHWIIFDTCYYCNIDSIYCFSDTVEYADPLAFVNSASKDELRLVDGLGRGKAAEIIAKRILAPFFSLEEVPVGRKVMGRIKKLELQTSHNHFTIDHFYHKKRFDFLSLCLYNFVPSCYSCNSKFKKEKRLGLGRATSLTSPSSELFDLRKEFSFKLLLRKELHEVDTTEDFALGYELLSGNPAHEEFIKALKIMGRYYHYKGEALSLIQKKVAYSEKKIGELASFLGKTNKEVKEDLFGKEYFNSSHDQKSLVKFKRDIARNINLMDVLC